MASSVSVSVRVRALGRALGTWDAASAESGVCYRSPLARGGGKLLRIGGRRGAECSPQNRFYRSKIWHTQPRKSHWETDRSDSKIRAALRIFPFCIGLSMGNVNSGAVSPPHTMAVPRRTVVSEPKEARCVLALLRGNMRCKQLFLNFSQAGTQELPSFSTVSSCQLQR